MQTRRQFVSDIQGELNSLSIDDRISPRLILSKGLDKVRLFLKQDMDSRRLFKIQDVWAKLDCVDLYEASISECGIHIPGAGTIMRSKKPLPDAFQTTYGSLVKVLTLDGSKEFRQTSLDKYKDIRKREHKDPNVLYWFPVDGHVFLPDSEVEGVLVWLLPQNHEQVAAFTGNTPCLPAMDQPFSCPDYLLDVVKKDLVVELAKIYKSIPPDERPNLNNIQKQ